MTVGSPRGPLPRSWLLELVSVVTVQGTHLGSTLQASELPHGIFGSSAWASSGLLHPLHTSRHVCTCISHAHGSEHRHPRRVLSKACGCSFGCAVPVPPALCCTTYLLGTGVYGIAICVRLGAGERHIHCTLAKLHCLHIGSDGAQHAYAMYYRYIRHLPVHNDSLEHPTPPPSSFQA